MLEQIMLIVAGSISGGLGGWMFGRRQKKAEAQGAELLNVEKIITMYQTALEDQKTANRELKESNDELKKQNTEILESLRLISNENKELHNEVKRLQRITEELRKENKGLNIKLNEIKSYQRKDD
jgi:chromosome segregation ATPase